MMGVSVKFYDFLVGFDHGKSNDDDGAVIFIDEMECSLFISLKER